MQSNRELTNRKILEELELNKKLLKQGSVLPNSSLNLPGGSVFNAASVPSSLSPDLQSLPLAQRTALNQAHAQSYGYYIPQDSSFGNLILPVLPRFEKK